jgi:hypothetical protein
MGRRELAADMALRLESTRDSSATGDVSQTNLLRAMHARREWRGSDAQPALGRLVPRRLKNRC